MCALREGIKPCKSYLSLSVLPLASFLMRFIFSSSFLFLFVCLFVFSGLFQTLIETTFQRLLITKTTQISKTLFLAIEQGTNRIPPVKYIYYPIFDSKIGF